MDRDNANNNNDLFGDILDIISIFINLINLELNTEQVNSLDAHLQKQDNEYLAKSIEQNSIIIEQNNEIIAMLKGLR